MRWKIEDGDEITQGRKSNRQLSSLNSFNSFNIDRKWKRERRVEKWRNGYKESIDMSSSYFLICSGNFWILNIHLHSFPPSSSSLLLCSVLLCFWKCWLCSSWRCWRCWSVEWSILLHLHICSIYLHICIVPSSSLFPPLFSFLFSLPPVYVHTQIYSVDLLTTTTTMTLTFTL